MLLPCPNLHRRLCWLLLQEKEYQTSISSGFLPQPAKDPAPADASNEQTQANAGEEKQMVNGHTSPLRVRSVSVEPTLASRASPRSAPDSPHSQHSTPTAVSPVRLSPRSQSFASSSSFCPSQSFPFIYLLSGSLSLRLVSILSFLLLGLFCAYMQSRVPPSSCTSLLQSSFLSLGDYQSLSMRMKPSSIIAYALASLKHLYTVGRIQAHEVMQMQQQWHQNEQRILYPTFRNPPAESQNIIFPVTYTQPTDH